MRLLLIEGPGDPIRGEQELDGAMSNQTVQLVAGMMALETLDAAGRRKSVETVGFEENAAAGIGYQGREFALERAAGPWKRGIGDHAIEDDRPELGDPAKQGGLFLDACQAVHHGSALPVIARQQVFDPLVLGPGCEFQASVRDSRERRQSRCKHHPTAR